MDDVKAIIRDLETRFTDALDAMEARLIQRVDEKYQEHAGEMNILQHQAKQVAAAHNLRLELIERKIVAHEKQLNTGEILLDEFREFRDKFYAMTQNNHVLFRPKS